VTGVSVSKRELERAARSRSASRAVRRMFDAAWLPRPVRRRAARAARQLVAVRLRSAASRARRAAGGYPSLRSAFQDDGQVLRPQYEADAALEIPHTPPEYESACASCCAAPDGVAWRPRRSCRAAFGAPRDASRASGGVSQSPITAEQFMAQPSGRAEVRSISTPAHEFVSRSGARGVRGAVRQCAREQ